MKHFPLYFLAALLLSNGSAQAQKEILCFTKSSGFEHSVISWKNGQPSHSEKVLLDLGKQNGWEFTFSKDGSKFGKDYLAQFDAIFFYTTGNLCESGTDKQPGMTPAGKQALFDYVRSGKGFIGAHSCSDTFHPDNESKKGEDRYVNHGEKADPFIRFLGGEFIKHGAQQVAINSVIDPKFPGFEKVPSTCHREDIWTNPVFQQILVGGIKWALGEAKAEVTPNLSQVAPGASTNPPFPEPKPASAKPRSV